jgi:hypothetical protein
MTKLAGIALVLAVGATVALSVGGCAADPPTEMFPADPAPAVSGPAWWGFGRDAQHTAIGVGPAQDLDRIVWQKHIDLAPPYTGGELSIHYGSPVITDQNTVLLPVRTDSGGHFQIEARSGGNGALIWSADSDYRPPPLDTWIASYNLSLSATGRLHAPGAGGKLWLRDAPDASTGTSQTAVFFGADAYAADPSTYDATVIIDTPITVDTSGNAFFGFMVTGANPAGLAGGIARVAADGTGAWVAASAAASDPAMVKAAANSAPAVSADQGTIYVVVNAVAAADYSQPGYLLALDSQTLATRARAALIDPISGAAAAVPDNSTSSPTVGPDGDVYFGVYEAVGVDHHGRGWLLHFDAALATSKIPGSFGWDDTASIVPAAMVGGYSGASPYLITTKYNNYGGQGATGDGRNRVAILDPGAGQADAYSSVTVMKEVLTLLGPTADPEVPGGVKEWCINTAAVDPASDSILINSEDGFLYRWDLGANQLSQSIRLSSGPIEAYTPTAIGADGAVYAISNAIMFVVGH